MDPGADLARETPALFDPTRMADVVMLSFKPNGEVDLSPEFKDDPVAELRFEASRLCLHLNWPKFRDARVVLYNQVARLVDRGERAAPQNYSALHFADDAFLNICRDLRNVMRARQEYSAAARVYVESFRHLWWVRDVVLKVAG